MENGFLRRIIPMNSRKVSGNAFSTFSAILISSAVTFAGEQPQPWEVNDPLVTIEKSIFIECTDPQAAPLCVLGYIGPDLDRYMIRAVERVDDVHAKPRAEFSGDNGRTWSVSVPLPDQIHQYQGIWSSESSFPSPVIYDPRSRMAVGFTLRQMKTEERYYHTTYYRLSPDLGRTWSKPKQVQYESGAAFDPENPLQPGYSDNNQAYPGLGTLLHSNGTLIHPLCLVNIPRDAPDPNPHKLHHWHIHRDSRSIGSLCMIGGWNPNRNDYDWTAGSPVWLPRHISLRGLNEPDIAELTEGRVLVVWRGSNTAMTAGRKWYSISSNGGRTFSDVQPWTYDNGARFYSSASPGNFLKHSNGRLYWLGNVCHSPPHGNHPRYPLILGEVNQRTGLLIRHSLTAIDDRQPHHSEAVQFSNCKFFEDRETHAIEIYLTAYGEHTDDWRHANCYKYTLTLN